jgi:CRP-like cAMP-binding protein
LQPVQHSSIALFLKRLLIRSALTADEQQGILNLSGRKQRVAAHQDIVSPGETIDSACLVISGLVARYDQMVDGKRQLTSFYIPGDMCDLHSVVAPTASWSITAVSHASVLRVPHWQLRELCTDSPAITLAFWRDGTADASIFAKWVGNLGRKNAIARIAHIFCEMGMRTEAAGLGTRTSYELPVTQEQLGEASGLTAVHVNRTLQEIRGRALLTFRSGHVEVPDWHALARIGEFDPAFLMLDRSPPLIAPTAQGQRPSLLQSH